MVPLLGILGSFLSGALSGLAGTLCMIAFEIPFWKKWGMEGVAEWQVNSAMLSMIFRKSVRKIPVGASVGMHTVHGVILGGILGFLVLFVSGVAGLLVLLLSANLYSLILWTFSPFGTRRIFESRAGFLMNRSGLVVSLISHVIYGSVLGLLLFLTL